MIVDGVLYWGLGLFARLALYSGLLVAIGSSVAYLVWDGSRDEVSDRLKQVLRFSVALVFVALLIDLASNTVSAFGVADAFSVESVRIMALESRWGGRWQPQVIVAAVTLGLVLLPGRFRAWILVPLAIVVVLRASSGHAAASPWWIAGLQSLHIGAAAGWIGTLYVLTSIRDGEQALLTRPLTLTRFSRIALVCAGTIALSGLAMAIVYIPSLPMLVELWYGRLVILKAVLLIGVGAFGAYNWRVLTPRLSEEDGSRRLMRSARLEVAIATVILLVSSVVVVLPHD